MLRSVVLLLGLLFPLGAAAQSESSLSAMGIGAGYVPPVEGFAVSVSLVPFHRIFGYRPLDNPDAPMTGGFAFRPFLAVDMIVTSDEDTPYVREEYTDFCMDSRTDAYVDAILCSPEIGFAGRLDLGFSPGQSGLLWAGPGLRYSQAGLEPYAFFGIGNEVFVRANVGSDFQQLEFGFLMGI
jgi:hypothetical protein